jgi:hypothetical protein
MGEIVAVGAPEMHSWWPGRFLGIEQDHTNDKLLQLLNLKNDSEFILVAGVDAPFIKCETIKDFVLNFTKLDGHKREVPYCTFRTTSHHKHLALMESGGENILYFDNRKDVIHITCHAPLHQRNRRLIPFTFISATTIVFDLISDFQFSLHDKSNRFKEQWNSSDENSRFPHRLAEFKLDNKKLTITFRNECVMTVSRPLEEDALYSRIAYAQSPLCVRGVIGTNQAGERINLKSGKLIHGRQAFPDIFEPFLGMMFCRLIHLPGIIYQHDKWLSQYNRLIPFFVGEDECKLISDDPLYVTMRYSENASEN